MIVLQTFLEWSGCWSSQCLQSDDSTNTLFVSQGCSRYVYGCEGLYCCRSTVILVWNVVNSLLCSAAEASVGSQQASAGGCVLSVCHAGRGGLHGTCAVLGLHPRDPSLCFQQVPGQCTQTSLL